MKTISLVVPVFQNEPNLAENLPRMLHAIRTIEGMRPELVLVDDGSTDRSFELLERFAEANPGEVTLVKLTRNFGQTPAIQAGLRHAAGDCVGIISADLQEPENALTDMLRHWRGGAQFVIGERHQRDEGRSHRAASSIYWRLVRRLALRDFPDAGYDFCLLDRAVVDEVCRINEKNTSIFVLLYWLGYKPAFVPIIRSVRRAGQSQWGLWRKVRITVDTLIGFSYFPARLIVVTSLMASCFSLIYLGIMLVIWARYRAAPPGWMTLAGIGFLGGALVLFSLGIISEYLVRILDETRKRPPFVVERVRRATDEGR
ncbi:MAG TPA: glycosyltransferase family 2 protein [Opitutaceae bacterium]|nr:glycosyltransferase family 2 protein [Opitutaceae bacterium]